MPRALMTVCLLLCLGLGSIDPALARQSLEATPIAPVGLELVFSLRKEAEPLDQATLIGIRSMLQRRLETLSLTGQVTRSRDGAILVHVDDTTNPEQTTRALASPPVLEVIDSYGEYLPPGTMVRTTLSTPGTVATPTPSKHIYKTIISGSDFLDVYPTEGAIAGEPVVGFTLTPEAAKRFYDFTDTHVGEPMSIVLDGSVISTPTIVGAIAAEGIIEGIPPEEVPVLVLQLRLGSRGGLLVLEESRIVP